MVGQLPEGEAVEGISSVASCVGARQEAKCSRGLCQMSKSKAHIILNDVILQLHLNCIRVIDKYVF